MAADGESIVDRARRVHSSLEKSGDRPPVRAAVGGPCPECGERVEIVVNADSSSFTCRACGTAFVIPD